MKIKNLWSVALMALVTLAGCNKEPNVGETDNSNDMNYLAVSIIANATDTKAGGDQTSGDPDGGATYEEGLKNENAVNKVRFYFFDKDGNISQCVRGNSNYYDWTPSSDGSSMPNVEKSLVATIVLQKVGDTGDNISETSYPTQVVAVLNPDYAALGTSNLPLADLRVMTSDFAASTTHDNGFVMCNSTYGGGTNGITRIATTAITAANVCKDPSSALANPVIMHVERCVAKVRVGYGEGMGIGEIVAAKDKDGNNVEVTEYNTDGTPKADKKQVYVKLTGWNLTATTNKGWLSKHIYPASWTDATFGGMVWNYAPYYRSFWAENALNAGQDYFNFTQIGAGKTHLYTNENAGDNTNDDDPNAFERTYPTQVIVAAQLVDSEGNALEVCEYAGQKFVGENNLLRQMTNFASVYKRTGSEGAYVYTKIEPSDVKLVTALVNNSAVSGQQNHGRYYVELKLSDAHMADDDATVWTSSNISDATVINKSEVNTALKNIGHAKCWNDGLAYYYFPIRHLAPELTDAEIKAGTKHAGIYGVVRNHIYNCTINKIVGLGTPVYDPSETIWPEKPQPEQDTYIAAKINILSWRVVSQSVDLSSY